jgi:YidC/Oxa1 family membrane protein insertase
VFVPLLASLANLPTAPIAALGIDIPVWNQYVKLIEWVLNSLASNLHSGGLAIVAFTIIVKTLLLPLTVKSTRSAKAMQDLQPQIKELQKKHGKDRQRLNQEMMQLYGRHQINPMAGCLPVVLQLPIFFGLYSAILNMSKSGVGSWQGGFLWLPDLAHPDPLHILPFVAAAFQFVQSRMMRPYKQGPITDPQQQMMNSMMNFMPVTVIFFGWGFASGPVVYWATQSVYSVIQQWLITGWGSLREWAPWLPEMPEHRRLGYRPPREIVDPVVVSGEPHYPPGPYGWVQKWMAGKIEQRLEIKGQQQDARRGAAGEIVSGDDQPAPTVAATPPRGPRAAGGARNGARRQRGGAGARQVRNGASDQAEPRESERTGNGSRAIVIPRKAPSRSKSGSANGD